MSETFHSRLLGWTLVQSIRLVVVAIFVSASVMLVHRLGIWTTILLMSLGALGLCSSIAWMLSRVGVGRVTYVNRIAPIALPFGIRIGGGKLWPIVACSWAAWTTVAAAAAVYASSRFSLLPQSASSATNSATSHVLLIISLIVDGLGLAYFVNISVKRLGLHSSGRKPMIRLMTILLAAMAGGIALSRLGWPVTAVIVAGAPPLLVGGFYAAFFLVIVIAKPRWN